MSLNRITSFIFGIIFIVILYNIIYYALKVMYKDVRTGKKSKGRRVTQAHGLEIIKSTPKESLKNGSIIPVSETLSFGRKEDNSIVLNV